MFRMLDAAAVQSVEGVDDAHPGFVHLFDHHRAGAVAEQDAGVAVLVVHDGRHDFGPDDQHPLGVPGLDLGPGVLQGEDEPAAGSLEVEAPGVLGADHFLDEPGRGREDHVRSHRGHDDQVHFTRA